MTRIIAAACAALCLLPAAAAAQLPVPDFTVAAARDTEPVVLTGEAFGDWAAPQNVNAKLPLTDLAECSGGVDPGQIDDPNNAVQQDEGCAHNHYAEPELESGEIRPGIPIGRLLGYRWDAAAKRWVQIPFQVDEQFTRYLDNSASGFALYSGQDQHTTYAYDGPADREGFRWHAQSAQNACLAEPAEPAASDPVRGFDTNDEVAFMAGDAGPAAPADALLPHGIEAARQIAVADPTARSEPRYVYVMRAREGGPRPAFRATNGYVRYERDDDANVFRFSQSSYDNYGNARRGRFWDPSTKNCRGAEPTKENLARCAEIDRPNEEGFYDCPQRRRPADTATITTSRYEFRYDGRWLMTGIRVRDDKSRPFGPDLVDRWKARAFAQDPGSETPCCGFEEEDANWGGSSTLLGERVGPVRAIRETWGADSGTNVIRRETFYNAEMRQKTHLRVHPIPPLDGIYAQWDFNAAVMTRFFNTHRPEGVPVDGRNDEVFGNLDDPCNAKYDDPAGVQETSDLDQGYREAYRGIPGLCEPAFGQEDLVFPYHQSVDVADPTFSQANAGLEWSQTSGPHGTLVDRTTASAREVTPGGTPQALVAFPYYRDDSCFDDGTGTDPGPKIALRSGNEPATTADGTPRSCWQPEDGLPGGDPRFYQGSIATHGLHLMFVVESDNARLQMPVNEINSEHRMVMLPGDQGGSVGERYGRNFEKPLVPVTTPFAGGGEEPPPRARKRCVPRRLAVGRRGIGKARVGATRRGVSRRLGRPGRRTRWAHRWCVRGGGRLAVVYSKAGRARLLATTGRGHRYGGLAPGDRARRGFRRGHVIAGVKRGRVRYLAVADSRLLRNRAQLARYLRRTGL